VTLYSNHMSLKKFFDSLRRTKSNGENRSGRARSQSSPGLTPASPTFFPNANAFHIGSFQYYENGGRGREGVSQFVVSLQEV
jgi:hypothetical protein